LAVISLIAVASFATGAAAEQGYVTPPQVFAGAIANFLATLNLPKDTIFTLINLAVSAFALTSLDSVARVGRLSFQELFQDSDTVEVGPVRKVLTNKYFATVVTLALAYVLAKAGYSAIWPLFGSANQLLSVLSFIACAVFLKRTKRASGMMYVPIFVMMAVTFTALSIKIVQLSGSLFGSLSTNPFADGLQLVFAVLVLGLGVCVAYQGIKALFMGKTEEEEAANAVETSNVTAQ
ncbi:MAG: carbon starvation CstA 5TM domain-containing protein, partial [Eubacteriales bacterium]|nr:carbon starvation CstA 5TM domain-containing protein [Eubacteriales bacterium]